jgi:hypothetical protein
MADIEHIDLDGKRFEDTSKALREYAASLKRKLARAEAEASTYRRQLAAKVLGEVVKPFANPDRVKQALLADEVDPLDGTAVRAWLIENGADYAQAATVPEEPPEAQGLQFDPEQDQFERWLEATGQGVWSAPMEGRTNER